MARMRRIVELGVVASGLGLLLMFFASRTRHLEYSFLKQGMHSKDLTGHYPYVRPEPLPWHPPLPTYLNSSSLQVDQVPDRIIVLTALTGEDTRWIAKELPGWNSSVFVLEPVFTKFYGGRARVDAGRIAATYLHYIIENYHALPQTMVFLNFHLTDQSPNPKDPDLDKIQVLRALDVQDIQQHGFANLRCMSKYGCLNEILPSRSPADEFRTTEVAMVKAWEGLFKNASLPEKISSPCCAEFAVSRDQVRKRGVEDYLQYWTWLHKTTMDDDTAGKVFEYIWHIIFGMSPVHCSELEQCE